MINREGLHGHPLYFELLEQLEEEYNTIPWENHIYERLTLQFESSCLWETEGLEPVWFYVALEGLGFLIEISGDNDVHQILQDMAQLHSDKNAGYAGHQNENPLANFYASEEYIGISAYHGCLVRLCDKYERIKHLRENPANDKVNESIIDTTRDLIAYALIAAILLEESGEGDEE